MFSIPKLGDVPSNTSLDSFFDDIFNDTHACTHTHTCNPPGPDDSHTHTCFQMHTNCPHSRAEDKIGEGTVLNGQGFSGCDLEKLQCMANSNSQTNELSGCEIGKAAYTAKSCSLKKRKGVTNG